MSAGMAGVIADALSKHRNYVRNEDFGGVICDECGWEVASKLPAVESTTARIVQHESHVVAMELTKAGYGNVQEAKADHVRAHTITVTETTAAGFDFQGCSDRNPDQCACSTYTEATCPLCDELIHDGELIQTVIYPTIHSVDYDSMDQEWETDAWHTACADPLAAALADPEGHALVKAIHDRKAEVGGCSTGPGAP